MYSRMKTTTMGVSRTPAQSRKVLTETRSATLRHLHQGLTTVLTSGQSRTRKPDVPGAAPGSSTQVARENDIGDNTMTTDKPWRETIARHRAAYEAFCWEEDHPAEVEWLRSPQGQAFVAKVRQQVKVAEGGCSSSGCTNPVYYEWGQCGPCYEYDLIDEQADYERELLDMNNDNEGGWE